MEWRRRGGEQDHQTLVQTLITSHDESADCGGKLGAHLRAIPTSTSDRADVRCCSAEYRGPLPPLLLIFLLPPRDARSTNDSLYDASRTYRAVSMYTKNFPLEFLFPGNFCHPISNFLSIPSHPFSRLAFTCAVMRAFRIIGLLLRNRLLVETGEPANRCHPLLPTHCVTRVACCPILAINTYVTDRV